MAVEDSPWPSGLSLRLGQCLLDTQAGSLNRIGADAELSFAVLKHCGLEL